MYTMTDREYLVVNIKGSICFFIQYHPEHPSCPLTKAISYRIIYKDNDPATDHTFTCVIEANCVDDQKSR